jgi:hypothetical protein
VLYLKPAVLWELTRLPELFCGFHKRSDVEGPTLYPVACSPQAWAAGSVFLLLESCLGIRVRPDEHLVELCSPELPENVDWVELTNLAVGNLAVDLRLQRDGDEISVDILKTDGDIDIKVQNNYFPASKTRE